MIIMRFLSIYLSVTAAQNTASQTNGTFACLWWYIEMESNISTNDALNTIMLYEITEYLDISFANISYNYDIDFDWKYCSNNTYQIAHLIYVNANITIDIPNNDNFINFTQLTDDITRDWRQFYDNNAISIFISGFSYSVCSVSWITTTSQTYIYDQTHEIQHNKESPTKNSTTLNTIINNDVFLPAICGCVSLLLLILFMCIYRTTNKKKTKPIHITAVSRIEIINEAETTELPLSDNNTLSEELEEIDAFAPTTFEDKAIDIADIKDNYNLKERKCDEMSDSEALYEAKYTPHEMCAKKDTNTLHGLQLKIGEKSHVVESLDNMSSETTFEMVSIHSEDMKSIYRSQIRRWFDKKLYKLLTERHEYVELFIKNGFDHMSIVKEMNEGDLISIGIHKLGHRKQILLEIQKL